MGTSGSSYPFDVELNVQSPTVPVAQQWSNDVDVEKKVE